MPVMDGLVLLQNIRESDADMPVFIMSGCAKNYDLPQIIRLKVEEIYTKPLDAIKIKKSIKMLLQKNNQ